MNTKLITPFIHKDHDTQDHRDYINGILCDPICQQQLENIKQDGLTLIDICKGMPILSFYEDKLFDYLDIQVHWIDGIYWVLGLKIPF
jgi:hypothetical protein